MSRNLEYTFPATNEDDVCLVQSTDGGGDILKLNGLLANSIDKEVNFLKRGYSRSVSISSVNDLTLDQFLVVGFQNGVKITEEIFGPGAGGTVYGLEIFDKITEIIVSGPAVQDVSIGTGTDGYFPLLGINLERPLIDYALSLATFNRTGIQTRIFATLDDIQQNAKSFNDNLIENNNIFELKAVSSEDFYRLPTADVGIYKSLLIEILGVALDADDEIQMKFIQI